MEQQYSLPINVSEPFTILNLIKDLRAIQTSTNKVTTFLNVFRRLRVKNEAPSGANFC